ncbi:hypothetical protein EHP00_560 [Ecytonucleospora hepatopenaei]|uniref:Uncharacterized protein n=1 Tax=Ecytonucleospora hepatopenaei TaxID=646526 RepID=A0A1W0E8I7_9MICR|nr:hypothetical protein EHP00_560 [Ecytonucleospora hepatopenaei]
MEYFDESENEINTRCNSLINKFKDVLNISYEKEAEGLFKKDEILENQTINILTEHPFEQEHKNENTNMTCNFTKHTNLNKNSFDSNDISINKSVDSDLLSNDYKINISKLIFDLKKSLNTKPLNEVLLCISNINNVKLCAVKNDLFINIDVQNCSISDIFNICKVFRKYNVIGEKSFLNILERILYMKESKKESFKESKKENKENIKDKYLNLSINTKVYVDNILLCFSKLIDSDSSKILEIDPLTVLKHAMDNTEEYKNIKRKYIKGILDENIEFTRIVSRETSNDMFINELFDILNEYLYILFEMTAIKHFKKEKIDKSSFKNGDFKEKTNNLINPGKLFFNEKKLKKRCISDLTAFLNDLKNNNCEDNNLIAQKIQQKTEKAIQNMFIKK